MKVLIIGSGGREHALAWKVAQSPLVERVYCAPGNAGIASVAECINIKANDIPGLLAYAKENSIDLTIVGPEDPLCNGIVDEFEKAGLKIFGPSKAAAQLEGSKVFTKELLYEHGVPTAFFKSFTEEEYGFARNLVDKMRPPFVIKADGLAAGKGVIICQNHGEAHDALNDIMVKKKFGTAGNTVIIEEFLEGEEASYIVLVDKNGNVLPLASSQDHKRAFDGDTGPNTGGMGAYSPAPVVTDEVEEKILNKIIYPVVQAMKEMGAPFSGFLYAGLMIKDDEPKVLEFNVRLGDPETQPILMRMKSDLVEFIISALEGNLNSHRIKWHDDPAVCVVMASKGYPGEYEKGRIIFGIEVAEKTGTGAVVFHAGTAMDDEKGLVITSGGRVLGITALGSDFATAKKNAYDAASKINCNNLFMRTDIADRAINRK